MYGPLYMGLLFQASPQLTLPCHVFFEDRVRSNLGANLMSFLRALISCSVWGLSGNLSRGIKEDESFILSFTITGTY